MPVVMVAAAVAAAAAVEEEVRVGQVVAVMEVGVGVAKGVVVAAGAMEVVVRAAAVEAMAAKEEGVNGWAPRGQEIRWHQRSTVGRVRSKWSRAGPYLELRRRCVV